MTELENLPYVDEYFYSAEDKKRASQVLRALEGLSIWKARDLLDRCARALELMEIHYG